MCLVSDGIYGRTTALVKRQLSRWGIGHSIFDPADPASAKALLTSNTRLIFVETISNPLLRVADLAGLARSAGRPAFRWSWTTRSPRSSAGRSSTAPAWWLHSVDEDDRRP